MALQTYGDELNWHPHLHSVVSDMAWDPQGNSHSRGGADSQTLSRLFQHHVLERLVRERRLSQQFAHRLRSWQHSGFQVHCGRSVGGEDEKALERLSAYVLRPSFAATRLRYDSAEGRIQYRTTKGFTRSMDALDWMALVSSHIPNPHEQTVRYYGWYANASRGKRRKRRFQASAQAATSRPSDHDSEAERFGRERRRTWARLLRKIDEVDPLRCPDCGGHLQIIAFIEEPEVLRKILPHLDLWQLPPRSPPPRLFPHQLEALLASLTPQQAQQIRAGTDSLFWEEVPLWKD